VQAEWTKLLSSDNSEIEKVLNSTDGMDGGVLLAFLNLIDCIDVDVDVQEEKNNVSPVGVPKRFGFQVSDFSVSSVPKTSTSKSSRNPGLKGNPDSSVIDETVDRIRKAGKCGIHEKELNNVAVSALLKKGVLRVPTRDHYRYVHLDYSDAWTIMRVSGNEVTRVTARRWTNMDGTVNFNLKKLYLATLAVTIMQRPGISFTNLANDFHPYLNPVDVDYLVNVELVQKRQIIEVKNIREDADDNDGIVQIEDLSNAYYIPSCKSLPEGWASLVPTRS